MKYKAIIADVDGTLIKPNKAPAPFPSEKMKKAVSACHERGVLFSLASARSLSWVENLIEGFDIKAPIILDNGAKIYDCGKKKYVWQSLLSKEAAKKALKILQNEGKRCSDAEIIVVDDEERITDLNKIKKWKISKIVALGFSSENAQKCYKKLKSIESTHVTRSISGIDPVEESVHITDQNATKQVALNKFSSLTNIDTKDIIGIGDSYNDFPLLMGCGLKVAMENAVQDIKEIADYIAPSYKEDGVAQVIEKYIL